MSNTVITPTVGRIVWFWPSHIPDVKPEKQPQAAIVTYVHDDRLINLSAFTHLGVPMAWNYVPLVQENDPKPDDGHYAQWMPGRCKPTASIRWSWSGW